MLPEPPPLTRAEVDLRLEFLQAEIRRLVLKRNSFDQEVENRVDMLCCDAAEEDQDYILDRVHAMVREAKGRV